MKPALAIFIFILIWIFSSAFAQSNCSRPYPLLAQILGAAGFPPRDKFDQSDEEIANKLQQLKIEYGSAQKGRRKEIETEALSIYFNSKTNALSRTFPLQDGFSEIVGTPSSIAVFLLRLNPMSAELKQLIAKLDEEDFLAICEIIKKKHEKDPSYQLPDFLAMQMLKRLEAISTKSGALKIVEWIASKGAVGEKIAEQIEGGLGLKNPKYISGDVVSDILETPISGNRKAVVQAALNSKVDFIQDEGALFASELGQEGDLYLRKLISDAIRGSKAFAIAENLNEAVWKEYLTKAPGYSRYIFLGRLTEYEPSPGRIQRLKDLLKDRMYASFATVMTMHWNAKYPSSELNDLFLKLLRSENPEIREGILSFYDNNVKVETFEKSLLWYPEDDFRFAPLKKLLTWLNRWIDHEHRILQEGEPRNSFMGVDPKDQRTPEPGFSLIAPYRLLESMTYSHDEKIRSEVIQMIRDLKIFTDDPIASDSELLQKFQMKVFDLH